MKRKSMRKKIKYSVQEEYNPRENDINKLVEEYDKTFIKQSKLMARDGRSVYIRPELHERITRIVQTIGGNQISLTDYLDNVLMHHFELFEQSITESYAKKQKPLF